LSSAPVQSFIYSLKEGYKTALPSVLIFGLFAIYKWFSTFSSRFIFVPFFVILFTLKYRLRNSGFQPCSSLAINNLFQQKLLTMEKTKLQYFCCLVEFTKENMYYLIYKLSCIP